MLVIIGFVSIMSVGGGVVMFGDMFYVFLKSVVKIVLGSGFLNIGNFVNINNGILGINMLDSDLFD